MTFRLPAFLRLLSKIVLLACWFVICGAAPAQNSPTATITGVVTDATGRPVSGARVFATRTGSPQGTPPIAETVSQDDGSFKMTLASGNYRIAVTRETFARVEKEVNLAAGEEFAWKVRLEIEPLSASVIVTAQVTPVAATSTPAQVSVVTRQEIEQREVVMLPDLLSTLPGFSLARTGREGGQATLFLDGGNSNYSKVLVDGAPINDSGGFMDFSNITLDNVEKIEVVHGAESAIYGSDAMAGVIQIFTKRGETRRPELDLVGDGGSFGTGHGSAELSGLLGRLDYAAGATYFATAGQGPNDFFYNRALSGNFGWKISDTDTLRVSLRNNTSDAGVPGQTLFLPPDLAQHNNLHDFSGSFVWDAQTGRHWHWRVTGTEADLRGTDSDEPIFVSTSQFNRAAGTAQASYLFSGAALTAGYMYEVENGFPGALGGQHARRNNQAGYVDGRWQVTHRLTVNAGARAEDNSSFGTHVVPRVGAAYLLRAGAGLVGDTRVHAFYGQGIDEPRLDQSFGSDPCFPGNPSLLPEESKTASGGIDQGFAGNRVHISADYFYNQFHDIISFAFLLPTAGCPFGTGTFFNTDLSVARGVNLTADVHPVKWLRLSGNYAYDDSRVLAAPNAFDPTEVAGNHLFRRPVNSGSAAANIAWKRFNGNILGYFSGARTDSDFLGLGLTHNPGYARFDVTTSYRMQRNVTLFARAANIFNRQYQDALGYPALGREVRVGIKLRFGGE